MVGDVRFSLAMEDSLAEELCKFKESRDCDRNIIERLLHYYKPFPLFNLIFLKRYYGKDVLQSLLSSKVNWGDAEQNNLEQIALNTIYKVILSNDKTKTQFPYIYIFDDILENNFTATFNKKKSRNKAIEHLKALLSNANYIFIYDLYIANNWTSFLNFTRQCFPKKQLVILYPKEIASNSGCHHIKEEQKLTQEQCSQVIQIGGKSSNKKLWTFKPDNTHLNFKNLHDRYLIIDNKIEIIFTSGIDYLMDDSKDFTYIVRTHKAR